MVAGVGAGLFVTWRVTDDRHVTRCGAHDFAHATSSIADDDDCGGGRRFTVGAAVLQKRHIRLGHTGNDCCAHPKFRAPGE